MTPSSNPRVSTARSRPGTVVLRAHFLAEPVHLPDLSENLRAGLLWQALCTRNARARPAHAERGSRGAAVAARPAEATAFPGVRSASQSDCGLQPAASSRRTSSRFFRPDPPLRSILIATPDLRERPAVKPAMHASIVIFRTNTLHGHLRATGLCCTISPTLRPSAMSPVSDFRLLGITCLDPGPWGNRIGNELATGLLPNAAARGSTRRKRGAVSNSRRGAGKLT